MQNWGNFILFRMRLLREKIEVGGLTRILRYGPGTWLRTGRSSEQPAGRPAFQREMRSWYR